MNEVIKLGIDWCIITLKLYYVQLFLCNGGLLLCAML